MTAFEWDRALETGDPSVDEQHRRLYELFSRVRDTEDSPENVREVLAEMSEYTLVHFAMEEDLMARSGYPADLTEEHLAEHRAFLEDTRERIVTCQIEGPPSIECLVEYLRDWLAEHVDERDRALVDHLRGARFAPPGEAGSAS